jgi:hypothetical protein
MWDTIAKYAVKLALWAVKHPDDVKKIVDTVHEAKKAIDAQSK